MKIKCQHAIHYVSLKTFENIRNIWNSAANHSSFNCVTNNLGEILRGVNDWIAQSQTKLAVIL